MKRILLTVITMILTLIVFAGCTDITVSPTTTNTPEPTVSAAVTPKPSSAAADTTEPTVSVTVTPEPTPIPVVENYILSSDSTILRGGIKISDLESYFELTQSELIQKLGDGYKFTGHGPEGREFCVYNKLGLTLYYNLDQDNLEESPLQFIYCDIDKLELNGLTPDMNFEQIQERIGKGNIALKNQPEDSPTYDLTYKIGNIMLIFSSYTKDVKDGYEVSVCQADSY